MDYCGPLGIPHSAFLSWSDDDQDKAIAHMLHGHTVCQRCGTNPEDWVDEEGRYIEPPPYEVATRACTGCATLERARKDIPKERRSSVDVFLRRVFAGGRRTGGGSPKGR